MGCLDGERLFNLRIRRNGEVQQDQRRDRQCEQDVLDRLLELCTFLSNEDLPIIRRILEVQIELCYIGSLRCKVEELHLQLKQALAQPLAAASPHSIFWQ